MNDMASNASPLIVLAKASLRHIVLLLKRVAPSTRFRYIAPR